MTPAPKVNKGKGQATDKAPPVEGEGEGGKGVEDEEDKDGSPALPQELEELRLLEAALAGIGGQGSEEIPSQRESTPPFDPWAPIPLAVVKADQRVEEVWT